MNGINGIGGPPALWSEARNADGRVYYYNTQTKATQWTKPQELMSPAEVSLETCLDVYIPCLQVVASFGKPAMERIHCRRWAEVLVQYRVKTGLFPRFSNCLTLWKGSLCLASRFARKTCLTTRSSHKCGNADFAIIFRALGKCQRSTKLLLLRQPQR